MRILGFLFQIAVFLTLFSCEKQDSSKADFSEHFIHSRDDGISLQRFPLYSVKVPSYWITNDSSPSISIADTRKPLQEYLIQEAEGTIKISIHNFPTKTLNERIPPNAQIHRWRNQFDSLIPSLTFIANESHDGFIGLLLEAEGTLNNKPTKILGWAMQLAPEYCEQLNDDDMSPYLQQACSDYTIKVVGPPNLIKKYRQDIITFANSFALILPYDDLLQLDAK